ncbi:putative minichromosome maintenance protein [Helianthus annuus]|uniref:Minichromosome maintenance protein n=1 Tax=Helianthus annuus TaxID=4232 RepID=A0A251TL54_HELAN|nr:protein MCM10 homolog [Helianthus annuus]KAF5786286.1 putative minichromosome maintenance protein [Helianthus annuus]KAJ0513724.1 putative minichromosome maintenance protein [Helianthus annuus]KAJ0521629.1 putative minichromosome maintenance protein [Helianthus annuus]KAJ0529828.1 putative minichromosome maintenance protein [Helianthus annuus]KAJ0696702.1 putative minichromosome maintenance protein [Helianthus annuus]
MSTHGDDLDLLLSLQDRVLETPPSSPSPGYLSDDGSGRQRGQADMSVFRTAVEDCLDYEPESCKKNLKSNRVKTSSDVDVEKFSGLRIKNQLVSKMELSDRFEDIRFVRLTAIKNLLSGDTLSGCWATAGVLCSTGEKRTSSTGKPYTIWEISCLNEKTVSVFLFGNAYQKNCKEEAGTVFALFNCGVRKNPKSKEGFTLTVFNAPQLLKMGTSADFGQCKSCTQIINKRNGIYCQYHKKNASQKYSTKRVEFMGGNLKTAFNFKEKMQSEGIYMVENQTNVSKPGQPKKVLSVEGLRKALSNAGKVTTNEYSQGIRFLTEVAGKPSSTVNQPNKSSDKRKTPIGGSNPPEVKTSQQLNAKRIKIEKGQTSAVKVKEGAQKMVELEILSSDDELTFL